MTDRQTNKLIDKHAKINERKKNRRLLEDRKLKVMYLYIW